MTRLLLRMTAVLVVACAASLMPHLAAQGRPPALPLPPVPPTAPAMQVPRVPPPPPGADLPVPPRPPSPDVSPFQDPDFDWDPWRRRDGRFGRPVVRIGESYTLSAGDEVREVMVIGGDATIAGHVRGDVTVILGTARLAGTSRVDGSFISIAGGAVIAEGAAVRRDLVVIAGMLDAPQSFMAGGDQVFIGGGALGGPLRHIGPWLTRGAMWGRLIVPDLAWMWVVIGIAFLLYLVLALVFERPVRACADALADKPLTAAGAGILVLLLAGPVFLLMTISVVGVIVIPFVACALVVAWIMGSVGAAQWIGMSMLRREPSQQRRMALLSVAIGFVVLTAAYMVPVLSLVTWASIGILGLGGATLAFIDGYQRERPARPAAPPPTTAPPAMPPPCPSTPPPPPMGQNSEAADVSSPPPIPPSAAGVPLLALPHASFGDRLCAFALDVVLTLFVWNLLDERDRGGTFFALLLAYHIGFWAWKQTTVGGIICQVRVVRVDGARLGFAEALVRGLSAIFSLVVLGLGCLWIIRDPERQAWHDKIAGTYVVKVPRHWPI